MSIATAIQNAQQKVAAAYTAVSSKGGTLPQTQDLSNLPTAINSISDGGSTTKYGATVDTFLGDTDENGILYEPDVDTDLVFTGVKGMKDYALYHKFYHDPDVESVTFPDLEELLNSNQMGSNALNSSFSNCSKLSSASFPKLKKVNGASSMRYAFQSCPLLTSVNFDNLEEAKGTDAMYGTLYGCTGLTTLSFSKLKVGYMGQICYNCSGLTSVSFPAMTEVGYQGMYQSFNGCTSLATVSMPELVKLSGQQAMRYAFGGCTALQTVTFPKLSLIDNQNVFQYCFLTCTNLTSVSFPALTSSSFGSYTNQFDHMLQSVTGCTVHFPSNLQSVIGSWTDVTAGFNGTNTTVLFDLPATE